jgi:hypothetical protein
MAPDTGGTELVGVNVLRAFDQFGKGCNGGLGLLGGGLTTLKKAETGLRLEVADVPLAELLLRHEKVGPLLGKPLTETTFAVDLAHRGLLKQACW